MCTVYVLLSYLAQWWCYRRSICISNCWEWYNWVPNVSNQYIVRTPSGKTNPISLFSTRANNNVSCDVQSIVYIRKCSANIYYCCYLYYSCNIRNLSEMYVFILHHHNQTRISHQCVWLDTDTPTGRFWCLRASQWHCCLQQYDLCTRYDCFFVLHIIRSNS